MTFNRKSVSLTPQAMERRRQGRPRQVQQRHRLHYHPQGPSQELWPVPLARCRVGLSSAEETEASPQWPPPFWPMPARPPARSVVARFQKSQRKTRPSRRRRKSHLRKLPSLLLLQRKKRSRPNHQGLLHPHLHPSQTHLHLSQRLHHHQPNLKRLLPTGSAMTPKVSC